MPDVIIDKPTDYVLINTNLDKHLITVWYDNILITRQQYTHPITVGDYYEFRSEIIKYIQTWEKRIYKKAISCSGSAKPDRNITQSTIPAKPWLFRVASG